MPKCGNCGKDGATVAEIRQCYQFGALLDSPELAEVLAMPDTLMPEITDGMWRTPDGTIYKVQWNLAKTRLYAKRLDVSTSGDPGDPDTSVGFSYAPGGPALLRRERAAKLTLEEAKEFGALYGTCAICGRTLTNETSIEAGIGPICAGRLDA